MEVWIGKIMNTHGKQVLWVDRPVAALLIGTHRAELKMDAYQRALFLFLLFFNLRYTVTFNFKLFYSNEK